MHIPVHISKQTSEKEKIERLPPVRKIIKRSNKLLESAEMPVIININPRSIYNKSDELPLLIEQYEASILCMSESWERENYKLEDLLKIENFKIITNVKQRNFKGGKPAIFINENKFYVKKLCPDPITVPIGVEAVWCLITPKVQNSRIIKKIAVASIYYRGPKSTKKKELFDHISETYYYLTALYGTDLHFIIAGDTNRLNLAPILSLSPRLKQCVKVPTRLNPAAILDPIITTLHQWYLEPVTMPPINNNEESGKPSDHLVVLMRPISAQFPSPPRQYYTVQTRPITESGLRYFGQWITNHSWRDLYTCTDVNRKAEMLQSVLLDKYYRVFPIKCIKLCRDDKPWVTGNLKKLDRARKREFLKNKASEKWIKLDIEFKKLCENEKVKYFENIVKDLKDSNPGQWYSKLKRMSGQEIKKAENISIPELEVKSDRSQAEIIADHYAKISNSFEPLNKDDFQQFLTENSNSLPPTVEVESVVKKIKSMNKKAATLEGDVPMRVIAEFAEELAFPLSNIINESLLQGVYPKIWKMEVVTPVPKVHPAEKLTQLRKISGLVNFSKVTDKIIAEYLAEDMASSRDMSQYGNEKGISIEHYMIKMLHKILCTVDENSKNEAFAVILSMIDWAQAFDRQSHYLGIKSFIQNGVRPALIPLLIDFFQDRKMEVKWKGLRSSSRPLNGGGPQGGTLGIIEYTSQINNNSNFVPSSEKFKFIDDLSILELICLLSQGLASFYHKHCVPSDISTGGAYLPPENTKTQIYLKNLSNWTKKKEMKLNVEKTKYMIINFTTNHQFQTRLNLEGQLIDQVHQARLLGLLISDDLTWKANTDHLVKKAFKRMSILSNLLSFSVPLHELIHIYILYIRSVVEQACIVWHSSLTKGESLDLERIQKVALRIILGRSYTTYEEALKTCNLKSLSERRSELSLRFAKKCVKNPRTADIFPLHNPIRRTRITEKFEVTSANTERLAKSAIPFMQRLLNNHT